MHALLDNALKYTKTDVSPIIQLNVLEKEQVWEFSIIDNGIGISPADLEKVFQPFFRSNALKHPDIKGIGVGLSIVQRLCSLLKIDISMASAEQEGTKVVLIFQALPK